MADYIHAFCQWLILVSDDDFMLDGEMRRNVGITLPANENAVYNIGISPLYINRSGFSRGLGGAMAIDLHGQGGYLWSKATLRAGRSYFLQVGPDYVFPNQETNSFYFFSLRCLVSTTNS